MDSRGEVSQILSGLTFKLLIGTIFLMREKATYSPQNYIKVAFLHIKNIVPIKSNATLRSSKFATPLHDYPSLL